MALATRDFERAAKANVKDFGVYELLGQAGLYAARGQLAAGRPAGAQIERGLQLIAKGRQVAGEDQPSLLYAEAELQLLRAETVRGTEQRAAAARRAVAAFAGAMRLRPSVGPRAAPGLARARRLAGEAERAPD